jgi:DNA invertase Pin-like site-specific DNA recombinase
MLVGYMRVSKADGSQVTDLQRDALLAAGVDARHVYEDASSGKRDDRPGLAACLKALREGDALVVWKLDRLGRDLRHLVNTVVIFQSPLQQIVKLLFNGMMGQRFAHRSGPDTAK